MRLFVVCLVAALAIVTTEALECTCPEPVHPQMDFCNKYTDYVIRARVLRAKEEREVEADAAGMKYHKMKYKVKIASVYKGNLYLNAGDVVNIYIPPNRCGFEMEQGKFYLISGTGTKKLNLKSNVCHWISKMSDLTFHQRLSLSQNRYKTACGENCDMLKPGCSFEAGVNEDCYDSYATCYRQAANKCAWRYGAGYYSCKSSP